MLKKSLTRKNITNKIFQKVGFSKNFSSKLIDDFFESFIIELIKSNKIKISSFGTFEVVNKRERIGRNPKTKVEVIIPPRNVISFIPSKFILKKINKI